MDIHERIEDGILFLRPLFDRIDTGTAPCLRETLAERVRGGNQVIVLNLDEVKFMDSCGLGALVSALRLLGGRGDLILCNLHEGISSTLRVTGMDQVLPVFEDEQRAKEWRASRFV